MIIRPATGDDAGAILTLLDALIATTTVEWTEATRTEEDVASWLADHEATLVADDGGEVVGVAAYGWFRDAVVRPGYRFTVEHTVHVSEDRWGTGVGRKLMVALIDAARRSGKHTMVAAIDSANVGSVQFHRRLGFIEVGRLPQTGAKFGRWLDLVLLQLRLDDREAPPETGP